MRKTIFTLVALLATFVMSAASCTPTPTIVWPNVPHPRRPIPTTTIQYDISDPVFPPSLGCEGAQCLPVPPTTICEGAQCPPPPCSGEGAFCEPVPTSTLPGSPPPLCEGANCP